MPAPRPPCRGLLPNQTFRLQSDAGQDCFTTQDFGSMFVFHSSLCADSNPGRAWRINLTLLFALVCCLPVSAQAPQTKLEPSVEVTLELVEPIHLDAAKEYTIYADENRTKQLTLRESAVSQWVNPRRSGGQLGHVFVWMDGETPAAMAAIFSFPWRGVATDRRIVHEFHALAPSRLRVTRQNQEARWQPKSGLHRKPIPSVAGAADSLARFKIQLRQVARRFSGHCIDPKNQRWELRLLPTPLLVYPINKTRNLRGFGAILGMMGDAGSDLESGLLIEAIPDESKTGGRVTQWSFAPLRMTDMETHLLLDKEPIWDSIRTETDTRFHDSSHCYFRFQDKTVALQVGP